MNHSVRLILAGVLAVSALSACEEKNKGADGGAVVTPPPPAPAARTQDGFGPGFAAAYDANPNSEPAEPAADAISPVSFTTEPKAI